MPEDTTTEVSTGEGSMKIETDHPVSVIPQYQNRSHVDFVSALQMVIPGLVAITVTVAYLVQVLETGNTDSQLGSSLPIIVAAYFVTHAGTIKRSGV